MKFDQSAWSKLQGDPQVLNAFLPTPTETPNDLHDLDMALANRYHTQNTAKIAKTIKSELGIPGNVDIHPDVNDLRDPKTNEQLNGLTVLPNTLTGRTNTDLYLDKTAPPETGFHEMAHVADYQSGNDSPFPEKQGYHHAMYPDFVPSALEQMQAQAQIENGMTPNQSVMSNMPWLEKVKALSSNKLPSPWDFGSPGEYEWSK